jgi:ribosome-associated heat shock protein Hsp15
MTLPDGASSSSTMRLDRWLHAVRLYKSRTLAAAAVSGGKVHVNGERVKAARGVQAGDVVSLTRGALEFECLVRALPARRGPAREAAACYEETAASSARRAQFAARLRAGTALAPHPEGRPDKHARKDLRRIRGRE